MRGKPAKDPVIATLADGQHGVLTPRAAPQSGVEHIEGYRVDFVWREARLVVEVDGYRYHRAPSRFEADRERDVKLGLKGWRLLRR